jgi:hypothetical protein
MNIIETKVKFACLHMYVCAMSGMWEKLQTRLNSLHYLLNKYIIKKLSESGKIIFEMSSWFSME